MCFMESKRLGGGVNFFFYVHPLFGEDFQFDEHIFQRGWFNHQLGGVFFVAHLSLALGETPPPWVC